MRKIRVFAYISLDGVMQPPGDDEYARGGWMESYRSEAGAEALAAAQGTHFDLLVGRRTYDLWASYWPNIKGGPFADKWNAAMKYVVTHRPESLTWRPAEAIGPDVAADVRRLKSKGGPDLIVSGSTTLTPILFDQGLVDEVVLIVYPVLLGQGKRFFSDRLDPRAFTLVNTKATPTSVLIHTYRHVGAMVDHNALLRRMYESFNRRDIPAVLAHLADGVEWANGMDGGHVHGREAVRDYWTRQWAAIQPQVHPLDITERGDGSVAVEVHQVVRDLEGKLLLDETVRHVFRIEAGLVTRFDIENAGGLSRISHA